ncbi:CcmD family protein [Solidesulfovibrio sp.]|nr:CcmD family protein [Solidesulfovibrio sp.]
MGKEVYLFAANVIVWVGIGCYVAFLAVSQKRLTKRLKRLEVLHDE